MRDNAGAIVAHTCTGVGQGDPFSSVFFELALLLKCFNPRPGFLMRTAVDYTLLRPAAAAFDTAITNCVLSILNLPPSWQAKVTDLHPPQTRWTGLHPSCWDSF
jgi:hypothetical protein